MSQIVSQPWWNGNARKESAAWDAPRVVDEAADLTVKPLVVSEENAQDLGQVGAAARPRGEDELPVRQPQQELLVHVLAQKQGALL
jgi:hypothetical protein